MSHGVTTLHKIRTYHSFFVDHSEIVGLGYPRRMHSRAPSHTTGVRGYHVSTHSGRILVWERTSVQSSHTTGLREYHVYIPFQSFLAIMVNMVTLGVWVRFW
jgi:hypothetical protein